MEPQYHIHWGGGGEGEEEEEERVGYLCVFMCLCEGEGHHTYPMGSFFVMQRFWLGLALLMGMV